MPEGPCDNWLVANRQGMVYAQTSFAVKLIHQTNETKYQVEDTCTINNESKGTRMKYTYCLITNYIQNMNYVKKVGVAKWDVWVGSVLSSQPWEGEVAVEVYFRGDFPGLNSFHSLLCQNLSTRLWTVAPSQLMQWFVF